MRTSLTEIKESEKFLKNQLSTQESLLFEARMLTNASLKSNLQFLKKVYDLLKFYNRKKLKGDIDAVHVKLFNDPEKADFQQSIFTLFKH